MSENPTFVEHLIIKYTDCSLERAREVESLMHAMTDRRLNDIQLLRFEALAREAEASVAILKGEV